MAAPRLIASVLFLISFVCSGAAISGLLQQKCRQKLYEPLITAAVVKAVADNPRLAAGLLRLHFHDCFVNGCDGSICNDDDNQSTEKYGLINAGLQDAALELVDKIKSQLDDACGGPEVSCADILAFVARDAVVSVGGPTWKVTAGRLDGMMSTKEVTLQGWLPIPFVQVNKGRDPVRGFPAFPSLLKVFQFVGLDLTDLVVLSGAHTIGKTHCFNFPDRSNPATPTALPIDDQLQAYLNRTCTNSFVEVDMDLAPNNGGDPRGGGDRFDNSYFRNIQKNYAAMTSDQTLASDPDARKIVDRLAKSNKVFRAQFAASMIRMGKISYKTLKPVDGGPPLPVYPGNTYGIRKGSCSRPA